MSCNCKLRLKNATGIRYICACLYVFSPGVVYVYVLCLFQLCRNVEIIMVVYLQLQLVRASPTTNRNGDPLLVRGHVRLVRHRRGTQWCPLISPTCMPPSSFFLTQISSICNALAIAIGFQPLRPAVSMGSGKEGIPCRYEYSIIPIKIRYYKFVVNNNTIIHTVLPNNWKITYA